MDTRQKMKEFLDGAEYLGQVTVAGLIGITAESFGRWLNKMDKCPTVEILAGKFLTNEGKRLDEIQAALKNGTGNRIRLHRQRAEILKKARIHQTTNQRVPSLMINN